MLTSSREERDVMQSYRQGANAYADLRDASRMISRGPFVPSRRRTVRF